MIWPDAQDKSAPSPLAAPLTVEQAAAVIRLAEAARAADGVAPLAEQTLLRLRHPASSADGAVARDLVLVAGAEAVAYGHLDPPGGQWRSAGDLSGELVVHPAHRRRGHGSELVSAMAASAAGRAIRVWAHGDLPAAAALARSTGFTRVRALWQMRRPLAGAPLPDPVFPPEVTLRTFRPGEDEEAWLDLNRRAFASHPEQGAWTRRDLEVREAEAWFDPAGFFLAERDGRLAGFHWTKIHPGEPEGPEDPGEPEGEVYVVGVDPAAHRAGLGRALTLAGLRYLRERGLASVMLYVDDDNTAAMRLYAALGFTRSNADVMYRHP